MQGEEFPLSIVIPTCNRGDVLEMCLGSLARQTIPSDSFEVVVSDDGSQDHTASVVELFAGERLKNLKYLRQDRRGAGAARNLAIRHARGALLLIINDDTIATAGMVEEHLAAHREFGEENRAVLGRVTVSDRIPPSVFARLHLDASFEKFDGRTELDWRGFITCNVSIKKSFLLKHGLFEEGIRVLHEDLELAERLSHHGLKIVYRPEALAYHHHFIDENGFLKSARQDGESLAIWYRKSPNLKDVLASLGFYPAMPILKRTRYLAEDLILNPVTIPCLLPVCRSLTKRHGEAGLWLYCRVYQAIKRAAIRRQLRKA